MAPTTGDRTARFLLSRARTAYGTTLRILPDPAADHLRSFADRIRHLIPDRDAGQGSRIPVPGRVEDPVVLLVALGCDGDRLELLDEQLRGCAARLVWLVDTDDPAVLSAHVVEWMAPAPTIQRAGFDPAAVRSARLSTISERYRPHRVVVVGPIGPLPDPILVAFRATGENVNVTGGIVLVVTTVHHPDDPRIRHRTIPSLQAVADVRYLSPAPGPLDTGGLQAPVARGPRLLRAVQALRYMLRTDVDLVVAHDPELLPLLWLTARRRNIPVVLDVHENLVARAGSHAGLGWLARAAVRGILRRCERTVLFTLAEDGYQSMFSRRHPVFPNHPTPTSLPHPRPTDPEGAIVYVGDVTRARGAVLLVEAVARANLDNPLLLIGRCHRSLREEIVDLADRLGVTVEVSGWLPHAEAMSRAAGAAVAVCPLTDTPNYRHSLPTKVLEYLAMGLPVVASDLPGTAAIIAGLPGVALVAPGDVEALADGLGAALPAAQRAAATGGSEAIRERHRWPATEVQTFYADLLEQPVTGDA